MDALVEEFSDARFIFVIRDCWSWLDSMLNMALCFGPDMPRWMVEHCRTILGPGYSANLAQNASELTRRLPLLVDAGLSYWSRANQFVLAALPMKRSLVLRTAELSGSLSRLAGFVGVPSRRCAPTCATYTAGSIATVRCGRSIGMSWWRGTRPIARN